MKLSFGFDLMILDGRIFGLLEGWIDFDFGLVWMNSLIIKLGVRVYIRDSISIWVLFKRNFIVWELLSKELSLIGFEIF
jgi:hypothetical protein